MRNHHSSRIWKGENMKFTTKQIALLGLLGALNGALEITLGNYLYVLNFYFTGNLMIGINCIVYMLGRKAVPKKGTILILGIITTLIKFVFGWNLKATSAIFMEALIMELAVSIIGFTLAGVIIGTVCANIWVICHKLIFVSLLGGENFIKTIFFFIEKSCNFLLFGKSFLLLSVIILVLFYSLWGIIFGLLGWKIVNRLYPRICSD